MNGKLEDKLAQLAFGELSPDEAARIEAEAQHDPEAMHALNMYLSMRSELRGLGEVPPDQISKERLRDAILAQGLRPAPVRTRSFGWLWMPVAASMLAVTFLTIKNSWMPQEPTIVMNTPVVSDMQATLTAPTRTPFNFEVAANPSVDSHVNPAEEERSTSRRSRPRTSVATMSRHADKSAAAVSEAERTALEAEAWNQLVASIDTPSEEVVNHAAPVADPITPPASAPPIIMIDDEVDESTGAMTATEVGASNVLIGG